MNAAAEDTSFDHLLDDRQRRMLEAMGITLWLPDLSHAATAEPVRPAAASELPRPPIDQPNLERNRPASLIKPAQIAIENIAISGFSSSPIATLASTHALVSLAPRPEGIEQMDWSVLQNAVAGCQACGLCQSRKNTVFGVGPQPSDAARAPQLDWLIVGEAPDEHEDAQSEPFVGPAGKLLDNMLAAMKMGIHEEGKPTGLSRQNDVYITNVLKCRPPAKRNPSAEEIALCEPYLARQIELLRPKIILAMGKYAISALTGSNEPVGKLRGRVHTLKHASYQAPVIVTYHPTYLLRNLPDKAKAWADLLLAMQTYRNLQAASP